MIETRSLTRHFDAITAVDGIDLAVPTGQLVALLGPNGAGKSTFVRMLTGLCTPTAGQAYVAGADVVRQPGRVRAHIGYVGQRHGTGQWHYGRDELKDHARAHGLDATAARARIEELTALLELDGLLDRKTMTLSGGQRRRLDVALGLVHRPTVLFLDEPSTGLDPQNRAAMHGHIRRIRDEGATVMLTTHYLEEADALADRVVVVDHGRVIADDDPTHLKATLGDRLTLEFDRPEAAARAREAVARAHTGAHVTVHDVTVAARLPEADRAAAQLVPALAAAGTPACRVHVRPSTLDDVFLELTGRRLRDATAEPSTPATEPAR